MYVLDGIEDYNTDEEDDILAPRSCQKVDLFHWFQNLPLGKTIELRHIVSRLIIHATFVFNNKDFEKFSEFVRLKYLKIEKSNSLRYENSLMDHFYHN